jgi:hypothetical protein
MALINYDEIDPSMRRLVRWITDRGFDLLHCEAASKGDSRESGNPASVRLRVPRNYLLDEADRLHAELAAAGIDIDAINVTDMAQIVASYDTGWRGACTIFLVGVNDANLPEAS